jgi:tetratricopeptide (TPR) repeat protein
VVGPIAVIAIIIGALASGEIRHTRYRSRLPSLPAFTHAPEAMRQRLTELDLAARLNPTSADVVGALGLGYHANLFYDQAEGSYRLAEDLGGDWRWSYYRALVHEARGETGAAIAALERAVTGSPQFVPAWWRLGESEFKQGRHDRAAAAWDRALTLSDPRRATDPGSPVRRVAAPIAAYAALGLARLDITRGNPDAARRRLEDAIASAPSFGPGVRLLGTAYAALGRVDDAARAARQADRLPGYDPYVDPTFELLVRESRSPSFLLQQAAAADVNTNAEWREYLISRALELEPDNADALSELAALHHALRRFDRALPLLTRLRQLRPDDPQVAADIGRCLSGLRRYAEAEPQLRAALAGRDDANTRYDLALVLDRTGRVREAITEYRRALDRNPSHRGALNNLGIALARGGRLADALQQFERLVTADPGNPDAHANFAALLQSVGQRERAVREFQTALDLDPGHTVAREALTRNQISVDSVAPSK